jgi:hypothetical protein
LKLFRHCKYLTEQKEYLYPTKCILASGAITFAAISFIPAPNEHQSQSGMQNSKERV